MILRMASLLRSILFAALLLRIAAGSAWAMPLAIALPDAHAPTAAATALPPCHGAQQATAPTVSHDAHLPASTHAHGAHCALCFPATSTVFTLPLANTRHSMPSAPMAQAFHWQRTPELRPPI